MNAAEASKLLLNVLTGTVSEVRGLARLKEFFPELAQRLELAIKKNRAHRRNANIACRHMLCAEALAEVLEARAADGRMRKGDRVGAIVEEYSERVPAKIRGFLKRPATERRRVQTAYPEVDLKQVRQALMQGKLAPEAVAGVLEEPADYRAFFRTVGLPESS